MEPQSWRLAFRSPAADDLAAAILALALVVAFDASALAGSWTLPEETGHLEFKTSRHVTAESNSRAALDPAAESFGFKPSIEYGLADRLTLGVNNEYQFVKSGLESERTIRTDGFMNTELFLRGRLRDQDWYMISAQDLMHLPGQESESGFSQVASSLRLQYGRSGKLAGGSWTSSIKNGFHPGLDDNPDKLLSDLAFSWRPVREWQLTAQSLNIMALDGDGAASGGDMAKGQLSVVRYFGGSLSVQLAGWQTVSDDDTLDSGGFDAVVWLRY